MALLVREPVVMKNKFSYILISFCILGVFLAPISPLIKINTTPEIVLQKNTAYAQLRYGGGGSDDAESDTTTTDLWNETGSCGFGNIIGCVEQIVYFFAVVIPSWFLVLAAKFFNYMATLTLSDVIYKSGFVDKMWKIVRDFSNIFFIIILLYAAFKMILEMGDGGGKKIVASVVLIALLVNFSLFFTRVVIDSSNVLALIFYNKIECKQTDGTPCPNEKISNEKTTGVQEKNLAGALISKFEINSFFTSKFIKDLKTDENNLGEKNKSKLSVEITLGLSLTYGIVVYTLAWAFLITALSFLGRTLMLVMLMMVSPLAFVTSTVPKFKGIDTIGFDDWIKKLFQTSFAAAVFMAILYIVSEILNSEVFKVNANPSVTSIASSIIQILIPAVLIAVLILKGSKYAQKASGEFTDVVISGAKMFGGFALGAATGGAAALGSGVIGGLASNRLSGEKGEALREKAKEKGMAGYAARLQLRALNYGSKATFDARKTSLGGMAGRATGMDFQSASMIGLGSKEGGFKGSTERRAKKLQEESELYKTTKSDKEVQDWSQNKQQEYDEKLASAKAASVGKKFDEEAFKKKEGERPKYYRSADELNKERMEAFTDNLGQTGLLGSLSHSVAKNTVGFVDAKETIKDENGKDVKNENYYKNTKVWEKWNEDRDSMIQKAKAAAVMDGKKFDKADEDEFKKRYDTLHKEPTADSINKDRTMKTKMVIGAGSMLAMGGLNAGKIGATLAGAYVGKEKLIEGSAESKVAGTIAKDLEKLKKVEDRLTDIKNILEKQKAVLEAGKSIAINGKDLFTSGKVDKDKIEEASAHLKVAGEDLSGRLKIINENIAKNIGGVPTPEQKDAKDKIIVEMKEVMKDSNKVNELKDIEEKIADKEKQLYDLSGKKSELKDSGKSSASSASTPKTP